MSRGKSEIIETLKLDTETNYQRSLLSLCYA